MAKSMGDNRSTAPSAETQYSIHPYHRLDDQSQKRPFAAQQHRPEYGPIHGLDRRFPLPIDRRLAQISCLLARQRRVVRLRDEQSVQVQLRPGPHRERPEQPAPRRVLFNDAAYQRPQLLPASQSAANAIVTRTALEKPSPRRLRRHNKQASKARPGLLNFLPLAPGRGVQTHPMNGAAVYTISAWTAHRAQTCPSRDEVERTAGYATKEASCEQRACIPRQRAGDDPRDEHVGGPPAVEPIDAA
jgi:hypothetical protein